MPYAAHTTQGLAASKGGDRAPPFTPALVTPCLPLLCQGLAARLSYELRALGQQHGMPTDAWGVHPATRGDGATFVGATVGIYTRAVCVCMSMTMTMSMSMCMFVHFVC